MYDISEKDVKSIMLEILNEIHNFCFQNGLKYSLYAGTLLGAIRHKGFIPWDDDIDIVLPREDYNYLITHYSSKRYKIYSPYNYKYYYLPFSKIVDVNTMLKNDYFKGKCEYLGVCVDIFPMDYLYSKEEYSYIYKRKLKLINELNLSYNTYSIKSCVKHPKYFIYKLFYENKYNKICIKLDKLFQKFNKLEHKYCMTNSIFVKDCRVFNINLFDKLILVEFENNKYCAFKEYDLFLKQLFGNYLEPPPKNKRISHHYDKYIYRYN